MFTKLLLFGASIICVSEALSDAQYKYDITKILLDCLKEHPVDNSEIMALHLYQVPTKMETKCLLACTYRTEGVLTEKGLYDQEHGYKMAKELAEGDEKRLESGKKVVDICAKVNDEIVNDGEKGCDRSALIFKCVVENAPKYGFQI